MADRDDRIRELAYLLWLEEGYPEGQAERHWLAAEILIDSGRLESEPIEGAEPPGKPTEDSATARGARGSGAKSQVFRRRGADPSGKDQ